MFNYLDNWKVPVRNMSALPVNQRRYDVAQSGEGKINLGIFHLLLGESSATWLYLLVVLFNFLFFFHISIASAFPSFINTSGRWTKFLQKLEINYFSFFDFVGACCIVKILFGLGQKN